MRRKSHGGHANHERWLVSYADFITLLFAFFVVMFASTQSDKKKVQQVSASVREALAHGQMSQALASVLRGRPGDTRTDKKAGDGPPPPDLASSMQTLNIKLDDELKTGRVELKLEARGLVISLREAGFFPSGGDMVNPDSYPALEKVATVVKSMQNPVRLEGHTDSRPIRNARFRNNWELSAARSIAVLELFANFGVPVERMAVAGYADVAPTDSNETEEGRAHNRRVDVVLLAKDAVAAEPVAAPGARKSGGH